jgi:hypothetical protein
MKLAFLVAITAVMLCACAAPQAPHDRFLNYMERQIVKKPRSQWTAEEWKSVERCYPKWVELRLQQRSYANSYRPPRFDGYNYVRQYQQVPQLYTPKRNYTDQYHMTPDFNGGYYLNPTGYGQGSQRYHATPDYNGGYNVRPGY